NNNAQGVTIAVEGNREQLLLFQKRLQQQKPLRSRIEQIISEWGDPVYYQTFEIRESTNDLQINIHYKTAVIIPDIATCDDCVRDIFDTKNRRYNYPFTNCTNCGSRYSIIKALPYDRPNTTMQKFQMCLDCEAEYGHPLDRRFHAQPNACPRCGPQLELWDRHGQILVGDRVILATADALRSGKIIAIKGLGGFQLVVDATNHAAIMELRNRKQRLHKPFALMYPNLESIQKDCQISALESQLLKSPESPIVLLQKWDKTIKPLVSNNNYIGAMLPYTPLHHLLLRELQIPIVATSGNIASEPICIDNQEAIACLGDIADLFLVHNRDIAQPVDDSVVRVIGDRPMVLRRARGYAPTSIRVSQDANKKILAMGGQFKNAIAISINNSIILSQYIGDLETTKAFEHFQKIIHQLSETYQFEPEAIACDAHPDYLSSLYAKQIAQSLQIPLIPVQHHHAHVLSAMVDHQLQPPVLGIAWDGLGYGTDGTIWGGEFLKITDFGFEHVAKLRKFSLLGGDKAAKEPRRVALSILWQIFGDRLWNLDLLAVKTLQQSFTSSELSLFKNLLKTDKNSPQTSSIGRLFDGVASLLNICQVSSFEGQAAIALEELCASIDTNTFYQLDVKDDGEIDWLNLIQSILEDIQNGLPIALIATRFHNSLVEVMLTIAQRIGLKQIVLTGGCFQNRYLTERAIQKLQKAGFQAYSHQNIPTNDGGLAIGQIIAAWQHRA
ncbi:MAG: carbamoyltransferase HypF, partial [Pseudanabaena sp. ELA748]